MVEKRREAKDKGERERYTDLIPEFQTRARKLKKVLLSEQWKEIEKKRARKTRDHIKKIRTTKGTFHSKMGTIKEINCMDLTGAEDIKKWQEYTEKQYK